MAELKKVMSVHFVRVVYSDTAVAKSDNCAPNTNKIIIL